MGLDQYMYKRNKNKKEESKEIAYWRKHSDLQGYMEELYAARGGQEEFNCIPLELSEEDIEELIIYATNEIKKYKEEKEEEIIHTTGFFFGQTEVEDWEYTLEVCESILETIDFETETVFYDSWW